MENAIVIIPARGGSQRIPKKNIKPFLGKPIISFVIETAIKSGICDEVMVSTDSEEIASIAKEYGANIPFMRDASLADGYTTTDAVIIDVINRYKAMGREFKYIICMYPTAPFVTVEHLKEAIKLMDEHKAKEVKMLAEFSFPPQRGMVIDENGYAEYKYKEYANTRSQDLSPIYHDVGQLYVYDTKLFVESNGSIVDGVVPLLVEEKDVQDIDNEQDWLMAELKYKMLNNLS